MKERILKIHEKIKSWVADVLLPKFIIPIILFVVYFLVVGPTSVVARWFYGRFLSKTSDAPNSNWVPIQNCELTMENTRKQS